MITTDYRNIDEYIATFPESTQKILKEIRKTMKKMIPDAEETISYGIPTFKKNGRPVVYFAGYKSHVSVYPAPRGNPMFSKELAEYKGGKGTVQFPLNQPIPLDLIKRIVDFRVRENEAGKEKKKTAKKA